MSDRLETELISKITELQQEAKEHQLVLDAFKKVEPTRKCFRLIGGVLVERTAQEIQPSLEENLINIDKAISNLEESLKKRREQRKVTDESETAKTTQAAPKIAAQSGPSVLA